MQVRELGDADKPALEAFLEPLRDTSMFLRANSRSRGLRYTGAPFESTYVAAIEAGRVVSVIGHGWNGMLLVQAPFHTELLARATAHISGRAVTGFSGPRGQVELVRAALGMSAARTRFAEDDALYALDLAELREPSTALEPIACRPAGAADRDELARWRLAYELERLRATDSEETRRRSDEFLSGQIEAGHAWVATSGDKLLSLSAFNAALPDIVQLGGIYTPPALRRRGYARRAIAAQLLDARGRGVTRAVLFTSDAHAVRCYESLGFRYIDDFALILMS